MDSDRLAKIVNGAIVLRHSRRYETSHIIGVRILSIPSPVRRRCRLELYPIRLWTVEPRLDRHTTGHRMAIAEWPRRYPRALSVSRLRNRRLVAISIRLNVTRVEENRAVQIGQSVILIAIRKPSPGTFAVAPRRIRLEEYRAY